MFDQFLSKASENRVTSDHLRRWNHLGWIGGGCAQPAVVSEALKALKTAGHAWCVSALPLLRRKAS